MHKIPLGTTETVTVSNDLFEFKNEILEFKCYNRKLELKYVYMNKKTWLKVE